MQARSIVEDSAAYAQRIDSLDALERVESEWAALYEECEDATPFQHPDWALTWARHFARDAVSTWAIRSAEGRLIGLAPWFRYPRDGSKVLAPLGGGHSDHHDLLTCRAHAGAASMALFEALSESDDWDLCELDQLAERSRLLKAELPPGLVETHRGESAPCPVLRLSRGQGSIRDVVPSHQLARFRKYRRRAERLGEIRLVRADASNEQSMLATFFDLHAACWQARGQAGVAADPKVRAFHREVAGRAARSGMLRLYALTAGKKTIASLYGFYSKIALFCYGQGFDPAMAAVSPGMLVVGSVLEDAAREGATLVDFLRGEEAYKFRWGAVSERAYERRIARTSAGRDASSRSRISRTSRA